MNSIIDINLDYRIKWYVHGSIPYPKEVKVNMLSLCFNWAPRHEGVLREWKYGATYSWWRWVVSFTLRPLYPQGKSPWYPLDRKLGGYQSRSGHGGEEKYSQPLPGLEPSIVQPVAQRYTTRFQLWSGQNGMLEDQEKNKESRSTVLLQTKQAIWPHTCSWWPL
jgi:hypothetical protein